MALPRQRSRVMCDVALQFGPLTIHWYGVLVVTGFMLGLWTASRRGLRDNFAPEKIMDLGPWLLGGAIIGSRLLSVISYWQEDFARQPIWEIFMIQKGGLRTEVRGMGQMRRMKRMSGGPISYRGMLIYWGRWGL